MAAKAISYQLSAISYQLLAISYQLSVISYQLSVVSHWLVAGLDWNRRHEISSPATLIIRRSPL